LIYSTAFARKHTIVRLAARYSLNLTKAIITGLAQNTQ